MCYSKIKRISAWLTAIVLLVSLLPLSGMAATAEGVSVYLHYDRPDGNYDGWSVWFWVEGSDSADIPLTDADGEKTAVYKVPEGASSVGFIVKQPNWAAKDVDMDQFVDVSACISGTVHVYVASDFTFASETNPDSCCTDRTMVA